MMGKKKELSENVTQVVDYMFRKYLNRSPDPEGLEAYRTALLGGMSLISFIKSISDSEEARQKRKGRRRRANLDWAVDDIDTVIALSYRLYLHREPDEAGKQGYRAAIERGMSVSTLADILSSSPEAEQKQQFFSPGNEKAGISDGAFIREIGYLLFESTVARPRDFEHFKQRLGEDPLNRMPVVQQLVSEQIIRREAQKNFRLEMDKCWIMGTNEFLTRESWDAKVASLDPAAMASPPHARLQELEQRKFRHTGEFRVSAIASMYKGGKYLETFLENIVSQSMFDQSELIIVDACSPDGEKELISRYMKVYPNIVYKRFDYRIGIYDAWNYAAQIARGKYLTNTNLDDLRRCDSFEIQAAALDRHAFADVVYQDIYYSLDFTFDFETISKCGFKSNLPIVTVNNMLEFNSPHNAPMWRKQLHEEIGYFDPSYRSAGDYEFWLRCLKGGKSFLKTNTPHVAYYQNPDGISTEADTPGIHEARRAWRAHAEELMSRDFEKSRAEFAHDLGLAEAPGTEVSDYDMVQQRLRSFAAEARAGWPEVRQVAQTA
ncbi:glycosyltransferase [Martelella radicis]|uniref:GT2 family glycosyltransferase n=1 Tax=Martelella radicis TaxID=1397476 RepID=A0A7W6KL42_9HYPH|nr:glycosyltransferase [Martelella radicis]MBB4123303.1 GT2 family glycosyltransferase [Martelella radicis]